MFGTVYDYNIINRSINTNNTYTNTLHTSAGQGETCALYKEGRVIFPLGKTLGTVYDYIIMY